MSGSSSRGRAVARVVLINLALLLVIVVALELVFGSWIGGPGTGLLRATTLKTYRFDTTPLYEGGGVVLYRRDLNGLRGAYDDVGAIDVLTLGGSTTDQRYIGDGATFQDVLARRFAEDGRRVSVVNAGRDGQSTVGHLRAFDEWFPTVPQLKARYLLAYIGVNDRHLDEVSRADYERFNDLNGLRRLYRYIGSRSAIAGVWEMIRGTAAARDERIGHGMARVRSTDPVTGASLWRRVERLPDPAPVEAALKSRLDGYEDRVGRLIARVREFGAVPIIVTQSEADYRVDGTGAVFALPGADGAPDVSNYQVMSAFNARAMRACRAAGAVCLDLGSELRFDDLDFYDICHNTPKGAARIADWLHDKLRDVIR